MYRDTQAEHLAVDKKGVDAHAGGHAEWEIGKNATKDGCQGTGEGSGCHHVLHLQSCWWWGGGLGCAGVHRGRHNTALTPHRTSGTEDLRVDQQNVRHCQECNDTGFNLCADG